MKRHNCFKAKIYRIKRAVYARFVKQKNGLKMNSTEVKLAELEANQKFILKRLDSLEKNTQINIDRLDKTVHELVYHMAQIKWIATGFASYFVMDKVGIVKVIQGLIL